MKILRLVLLLGILGVAVYAGWFVYTGVFELLDFQIGMYKTFLQAGKKVGAVQDSLGGMVEQALGLFGTELPDTTSGDELSDEQMKTISDKISGFEKKLHIISGVIGGIAGLLVRKILSDIVFGVKKTFSNVQKFLG